MKRTLSVFLASLLVALMLVPAFAADGTVNVTFNGPSSNYEGAYAYYQSVNGEFTSFVEDPEGGYGYYSVDGCYYFLDDLTAKSREVFDNAAPGSPESVRYSPAQCENGAVEAGSTVSFRVITNEVYDINTVSVMCNGDLLPQNANGEYAVTADRDLVFSVVERDENNQPILLKNHYTVTLGSGDGFAAKPLKDANNKVVYYGEDYEFRVKITKGYNGDNMKVQVIRGSNLLSEYIGEEADMLSTVTGEAESLSSTGVDADGYRTYKITNITSNCKVTISGVNKDSSSGILAMLKRILRLLLSMLGLNLDSLFGEENNPLAAYTVSLDPSINSAGVSYKITPEFTYSNTSGKWETEVLKGEGVTLVVTKANPDQNVRVVWNPGNETGTYTVNWQAYYDLATQKTTYSAVYYIDNISADTTITITAG